MPVRQRQVRNRTQLPYPVPRKAGQTASPTRNRCQSLQDPCLAGDRAPDPTEFCKSLDIQSSSFRLPARPLDLHVRRFRFFEIGNRRPGRVRYGTLSARGGRMVGPEDARGSWSGPGAGFRSHTLPRVFRDRRGLLASGARADDGTIPAGLGLITEGSRGWLKGDSAVWVCRLYIVNGQHGWYQISIRGPVSVS